MVGRGVVAAVGAFTTGKKSRDKYLVRIATALSLLPPLAVSPSRGVGANAPEHAGLATVPVAS